MAATEKSIVHLSFDGLVGRFPRHAIEAVVELNHAVDRCLSKMSPGWERPSADEAVLVAEAPWKGDGSPLDWADAVRRLIHSELGLDCSVGIASTRVAARVCSRLARPRGALLWLEGYERELIDDIPLEELDELTPEQVADLRSRGLRTLGEMACLSTEDARSLLGSSAVKLVGLVRGLDPETDRAEGSRLSRGVTLMSRRLSRRLVKASRRARGLELRVMFEDGVEKETYTLLPRPTSEPDALAAAARRLLSTAPQRECGVRGLTLTATGLTAVEGQLSLFQRAGPREVEVQLGRTS